MQTEIEPGVVVIGAGVVGLSAAIAAQARGLAVTVLERDPAGLRDPGERRELESVERELRPARRRGVERDAASELELVEDRRRRSLRGRAELRPALCRIEPRRAHVGCDRA